jgi:L-glutamine---4-(methylsulfanyl)-2-oxobutanoate aminotransferase
MTRLAQAHGAVNLAQGFPDFDGPQFAKDAAIDAINAGKSQYARMIGDPVLNAAIARHWHRATGREINPDTNVTVTSGCTEAIPATIFGLLNPGDKVIVFEPFYDSYRACMALAGVEPIYVRLEPPRDIRPEETCGEHGGTLCTRPFTFDHDQLRRAFAAGARAILLNTPHNPTGKVFTRDELKLIAELCVEHDVLAITDEVYEFLAYDEDMPHLRLAEFPEMWDRTVTLSSLGKTFSLTGWKIGWALGPEHLMQGVRAGHQFFTFSTATPLQHAAASALDHGSSYISELREDFSRKRKFLCLELAKIGFRVYCPSGTYFILVDYSGLRLPPEASADDRSFCKFATASLGVALIPTSVFYDHPGFSEQFARFAFCKRQETLDRAVARLQRFTNLNG